MSATNLESTGDVPKSAAQLKKEAKRKEKLEKFKQKQEKIQAKAQTVDKAPVCNFNRFSLLVIITDYCVTCSHACLYKLQVLKIDKYTELVSEK